MRGTFRFHAEFATAVRFLNEGLVNGKPVITGVLPVDRALEADVGAKHDVGPRVRFQQRQGSTDTRRQDVGQRARASREFRVAGEERLHLGSI